MRNKLLKVVGSWPAHRDEKELSAAQEAGFEVAVIAKGKPGDKMRLTEVDSGLAGMLPVYLCTTRPVSWLPVPVNRVISFFQWAWYVRRYKADVLSCHNIIALGIGYVSTLFMKKSEAPKLVYDAHEFEIGRNTGGKRGKIATFFIKHAEAFLMKRTAFNIMVNDTIADETMRIHRLKVRPLVIRNVPPKWKLDESAIAEQRRKFIELVPPPSRHNCLVMYHGAVMYGRGIENIIQLLTVNPNVTAIVLGNALVPEYLDSLVKLAEKLNVRDRVIFHPAAPYRELWKYVGAADIEFMALDASCQSYYYALPNKFFESIQALVPYVYSDFPEYRKITLKYDIGLLCNSYDINQVSEQIEKLRTDKELYQTCRNNMRRAKADLCWENEKMPLVNEYRRLLE